MIICNRIDWTLGFLLLLFGSTRAGIIGNWAKLLLFCCPNSRLYIILRNDRKYYIRFLVQSMVQLIQILGTLILGFCLEGIVCCAAYETAPAALLSTACLIFITILLTMITLEHVLLEKKHNLSMFILALLLLLTLYDAIIGLTILIYLNQFQLKIVPFNTNLLPFMIYTHNISFTATAWINLIFYFGNAITIGFFAREYYKIFWVDSVVNIYRYLKKRVKNLNQGLLSGLPVVQIHGQLRNAMCCLCLEEYNDTQPITKLSCGHYFHRNCIRIWVLKSNACPLCRRRVIYN